MDVRADTPWVLQGEPGERFDLRGLDPGDGAEIRAAEGLDAELEMTDAAFDPDGRSALAARLGRPGALGPRGPQRGRPGPSASRRHAAPRPASGSPRRLPP